MQCMMSKTRKNPREMSDLRENIPDQSCCLGLSVRIVVAQVALTLFSNIVVARRATYFSLLVFLSKERSAEHGLRQICPGFVQCLCDRSIDSRSAHAVVLVVGAARIPKERESEPDKFVNLDEVVSFGAALRPPSSLARGRLWCRICCCWQSFYCP